MSSRPRDARVVRLRGRSGFWLMVALAEQRYRGLRPAAARAYTLAFDKEG